MPAFNEPKLPPEYLPAPELPPPEYLPAPTPATYDPPTWFDLAGVIFGVLAVLHMTGVLSHLWQAL
jgi:hypothetical protein